MSKQNARDDFSEKDYDATKEAVRALFYSKLKAFGVQKAADLSEIDKDTLYSWNRPGGAVPNIADVYLLSRATGISVADWFESTPVLSEKDREYLAKVNAHAPLRAIIDMIPLQRFRIKGMPSVSISLPNTRANFKVHRLSLEPHSGFLQRSMIQDLAAGYGVDGGFEELENAYVEHAPKDTLVAMVRGDSMVSTLNNGDYILLSNFNGGTGYKLPRIDGDGHKLSFDAWLSRTGIKDGEIVVVDLGIGEGPTLKRVRYDVSRGKQKWKMQIVADNPSAWRGGLGYQVEVGDEPIFYARMIALCERV